MDLNFQVFQIHREVQQAHVVLMALMALLDQTLPLVLQVQVHLVVL